MESAKKILPYILVAIVFAVGGYFVARGVANSQQAALFRAMMLQTGGTKQSTTGPTNPNDPEPVYAYVLKDGVCWAVKRTLNEGDKLVPQDKFSAGNCPTFRSNASPSVNDAKATLGGVKATSTTTTETTMTR